MSDFESEEKPESKTPLLLDLLEKREVPTLNKLCEENECTIEDLPGVFAKKTEEILNYCEKYSSVTDVELNPQIDFIYKSYAATRDISDTDNLSDFSKSLDSFDSFIDHHAKGASRKTIGNLIERIDVYTRTVVHPSRIIAVFPEGHRMHDKLSIYNFEGHWVPLPTESSFVAEEYVEKDVLDEIIELQESNYTRPDLYHSTGSASLEGIAKHGAILSARKAVESGESVKTGEYNTYISRDGYSVSGGKEGLRSVYTSRILDTGYGVARWFNEHRVVFGISEERISKYLKEHKGETDIRFEDYSGEGIAIGPEVPLDVVGVIYGDRLYLDELNEWKEKNAPQARVVSFEAEYMLRTKGGRSYRTQGKEIIDWKSLLAQDAVVVN